jgi:hypothetical protein
MVFRGPHGVTRQHPRHALNASAVLDGGSSSCPDDDDDDDQLRVHEDEDDGDDAVGADPADEGVPESAYISASRNQVLGRPMHVDAGGGARPRGVVSSAHRQAQDRAQMQQQRRAASESAGGTKRPRGAGLGDDECEEDDGECEVQEDDDEMRDFEEIVRNSRPSQRRRRAPPRTRRPAPDPSLRDLSGLWSDGDAPPGGDVPPGDEEPPGGDDAPPGGDDAPPGDDDDGPIDASAKARARERCWLCTFSTHPLSRLASRFCVFAPAV